MTLQRMGARVPAGREEKPKIASGSGRAQLAFAGVVKTGGDLSVGQDNEI